MAEKSGGRLAGKVCLVTGAGSGIGRAVALEFAREGASIVVNDLPPPEREAGEPSKKRKKVHVGDGEATAAKIRELGQEALVCLVDVSKRDAVAKMVEDTVAKFGRIDVVVSNAYYSDRADFLTQEWDNVLKTFEVTQFGCWHVCQHAAAKMAKQTGGSRNGKLIIISSVMAETPHLLPTSTAYNMAKGALDTMTHSLASGLAQHRITVNCIHPGWILTDGETNFVEKEKIEALANKALPFGVGKPEDVAKGCVYLASADGDYVTGAILNIDGGWCVSPRIPHLQDPIIEPPKEGTNNGGGAEAGGGTA